MKRSLASEMVKERQQIRQRRLHVTSVTRGSRPSEVYNHTLQHSESGSVYAACDTSNMPDGAQA